MAQKGVLGSIDIDSQMWRGRRDRPSANVLNDRTQPRGRPVAVALDTPLGADQTRRLVLTVEDTDVEVEIDALVHRTLEVVDHERIVFRLENIELVGDLWLIGRRI